MPLLRVPRRHVARASAVLEGTLTECRPINGSCVTVVNLRISMVNLYPRPPCYTDERDRDLNPHTIVLFIGPIFRLQVPAPCLRATPPAL